VLATLEIGSRVKGALDLAGTWTKFSFRINGQQHYLGRAVDQDGDAIDILVSHVAINGTSERFIRRLWGKSCSRLITLTEHKWIIHSFLPSAEVITDNLRSCSAAMRTILGEVTHKTERYASNRPKSRISLPAKGNGICEDSNLPAKLSGFSPLKASSRICFDGDATC
jgi:hypothetical protein